MRDDEFEWDDEKAASNFDKHRVTFEQAKAAFDDPDSLDREDPDLDEERWSRLCRTGQHVFVVVWTERGHRIRIISVRLATRHEQRTYFRR
jgi:uncharacterized DUF497 family protein